ncbi:MAG: PepSY domain-containing protein [Actinomycetota bacterium]
MTTIKIACILALTMAAAALPARAESDHDRARRAVQAGEVLPLQRILDKAQADYGGQFVGAELEDEEGRMVYEIILITPEGRVTKLHYDARDGSLIRARDRDRGRR